MLGHIRGDRQTHPHDSYCGDIWATPGHSRGSHPVDRSPLTAVNQNPDWHGCAEFHGAPEIQPLNLKVAVGHPRVQLVPSESGLGVLKLMSEVKVFLGAPRVCSSHHTGESDLRTTRRPSRPSILQPHSPLRRPQLPSASCSPGASLPTGSSSKLSALHSSIFLWLVTPLLTSYCVSVYVLVICLLSEKVSLYPPTRMTFLVTAISHAPGMVLGTQHKHDQMRERMSEIQGWAEPLCQKHDAHRSKLRLCPTSPVPGFDSGAGNQNRRPVSCAQALRQAPPWIPDPLPSLIPSGWLLPAAGLAPKGLPLYQLTMGLGVPVTRQASLTVSPSSAVQSASSSSKSGGPGNTNTGP